MCVCMCVYVYMCMCVCVCVHFNIVNPNFREWYSQLNLLCWNFLHFVSTFSFSFFVIYFIFILIYFHDH